MNRENVLDVSPDSRKPLATGRHFLIFTAVCVIFALIGVSAQLQPNPSNSSSPGPSAIVPLYLGTMIGEWFLLFFVWRGVRSFGGDLFAFVRRPKTSPAAVTDALVGVVLGIVLVCLDAFVQHVLGVDHAKSIDQLLPRGPLEIGLWIAVSITAGIVEELVYRGYLMGQLAARLKSVPLAIGAQALWFAGMHAYEGLHSVISIVVIGLILGVVANWRRNLRTNVVAHAVVDLIEGLAPDLIRF